IDFLLGVHVIVIPRRLHDVDHFKGQLTFVEGEEMRSVEFGGVHAFDDALYLGADLAHLVYRSIGADAEGEYDASGVHALVVVDDLRQQLGIGDDDLLAAEGADAGSLQADMLDGPGDVAEYHEVAYLEGLVDTDGHGGEHVAEQGLHRQCNGNTAHAQAGDHGGNIHPQVGQDR